LVSIRSFLDNTMPRTRRAPGKRPRAPAHHAKRARPARAANPPQSADQWIACPPPTLDELFQRMSESLDEASAFMQALHLMGLGMTELGRDEGDAVRTIADAAQARLHVVCDTWLDYIQAARR